MTTVEAKQPIQPREQAPSDYRGRSPVLLTLFRGLY